MSEAGTVVVITACRNEYDVEVADLTVRQLWCLLEENGERLGTYPLQELHEVLERLSRFIADIDENGVLELKQQPCHRASCQRCREFAEGWIDRPVTTDAEGGDA